MPSDPNKIAWGGVGARNSWTELPRWPDSTGVRMGIVRQVLPGVEYREPKTAIDYTTWRRDPGDRLTFGMSCDVLPVFQTLVILESRLRQSMQSRKGPDEALLAALDGAVRGLLSIAAQLHASSPPQFLGLAHPSNILLIGPPDRPPIVGTPDAGFYFDERAGAARPAWLENDAGHWRFLWDESPLDVNRLISSGRWTVGQDLRTIARLIAWLLVGEKRMGEWVGGRSDVPLRRIPNPDEADDTGAGVWRVLGDVLDPTGGAEGRIASASRFAERLTGESEPSEHFRSGLQSTNRAKSKPGKKAAGPSFLAGFLKAAGILLAVGTVVGVLFLAGRAYLDAPAPTSPTLCPDCPGTTRLRPDLEALHEFRKETVKPLALDDRLKRLGQELDILKRLHQPNLLHERTQVREREQACLAAVRADFLKELESSANQLLDENRDGTIPTPALPARGASVLTLHDDFLTLLVDTSLSEKPLWRLQLERTVDGLR
ncbi:MAG: hypothetical protein IT428_05780 [Planctomycetaceae bacterium]|nr:hypothetical protein [Planctomycetaceae bacterium]